MACSGFVSLFSRTAAVVAVVALAGCTTTGQFFKTEALADFVPGQTTFADAVRMLGAEPSNTYAQLNGAMLARWAHKGSILTDAIYVRQEATLRFDPAGRFVGVVDTVNILIPPREQNAQANVQPGQSQGPQSAPVASPQPVQEVERIIIIDSAGSAPVALPATPAAATQAAASIEPKSQVKVTERPQPEPAAPAAPATPRASNTLDNSLPNPTVTYPVPTGRR
ncbi:MAG: hypothetical protein AB7E59_07285 [Pusillimonas sp.]